MTQSLTCIVASADALAKRNYDSDVFCPTCGKRWYHRYGHYARYDPKHDAIIAIQRYACKNVECPRRTFSYPPSPLLPIMRLTCCILLSITAYNLNGKTKAAIARSLGLSFMRVHRALIRAASFSRWLDRERRAGTFPSSCPYFGAHNRFVMAFSQAFYPGR